MTCLHCHAETTNGLALCQRCQQTLTTSLVNVPAYFADVLAIQPGQRVKVRSAYRSAPPPSPEPGADRISETCDYVATIVYGWCRNLEDDRPGLTAGLPSSTESRCGWLESHLSSVLTLEWAGELLREMLDCERRLRRILDRADTGWYAGICGHEIGREETAEGVVPVTCARALYVTGRETWTRCPECGRTWDADERRKQMRREAEDRTVPVRVLARIAVGLTDEPSEAKLIRRIEQWVHRGTLTAAGTKVIDGRARRVYRIGDVLALIERERTDDDTAAAC